VAGPPTALASSSRPRYSKLLSTPTSPSSAMKGCRVALVRAKSEADAVKAVRLGVGCEVVETDGVAELDREEEAGGSGGCRGFAS
jgi:hypothetical protein